MAGHSKWANIKHRKGAQDAKKAKLFTKLGKEIIVAASTGQADIEFNPRLRSAVATARKAGLPKDRIEAAIKKGSGEIQSEQYSEARYEAYAPGGIALIIDVLTDNKNRSASDIRATLGKHGGNLAESGSVEFMFDRVGILLFEASVADENTMFEAATEAGASDVTSTEEGHEIICAVDDFATVRDLLTAKFDDPESAELTWIAQNEIELDQDKAESLLKLIDALEDIDDVQSVSGNYLIDDAILAALD